MVDWDLLYAASGPKGKTYGKLLDVVGNAVAKEKDFLEPGKTMERKAEIIVVGGKEIDNSLDDYNKLAETFEGLKASAEQDGLWVDFEIDPKTWSPIKSGPEEWEKKGPVSRGTKTYSFSVKGYRCYGRELLKNIDKISDTRKVEETVGKDRSAIVYSMLGLFADYEPSTSGTNTERIFGLGDAGLYEDLMKMLLAETDEMREKACSSWFSKLGWLGSKIAGYKLGKMDKRVRKRHAQIESLKDRFSEEG